VIENIYKNEFNSVINVPAYRTVAVKGHMIFTSIARFNQSSTTEQEFKDTISNIESFIIARGQYDEKETKKKQEEEDYPTNGKSKSPQKELVEEDWNF
jgi:hypothetical protein